MKTRFLIILVFAGFVFLIPNVFAITESFLVLSDTQKTFDIILNENQKVFFQIFVKGGENDDIRLKIIDSNTDFVYFNSIIRAEKQDTEYDSTIHPTYKSDISNIDTNPKNLTFVFDNSLSNPSDKRIDFAYTIFTEDGTNFEQTALWSWISTFVTIVIVVTSVIIVIVIILKKLKKRAR